MSKPRELEVVQVTDPTTGKSFPLTVGMKPTFTSRKHFTFWLFEDGEKVEELELYDPFITSTITVERPTLRDWFRGLVLGHRRTIVVKLRGDDAAHELIFGAADPKDWKGTATLEELRGPGDGRR